MRTIATAVKQSTMEIVAWFEVINTALHSPPLIILFFSLYMCIAFHCKLRFIFLCLDMVEQKGKG